MDEREQVELDRYIEELFIEYELRLIKSVLRRLGGNRQQAEDIVLEAFERLWNQLRKHPGKQIDNPLRYLFGIVRSLLANVFEDEEQNKIVSLDALKERRDDENQRFESLELIDNRSSNQPEVAAMINENLNRATDAMQALPNPNMRRTYQAHLYGYPDAEISEKFQQPDGTTRGYISKARVLVRARLEPLQDKGETWSNEC
jgi:RNA polymerase sigma factor (sigma-70 family)